MRFVNKLKRFLTSEDGPTAVEYAVMLALIVIVCLGAVQTLGTNTNTSFTNAAASMGGSYPGVQKSFESGGLARKSSGAVLVGSS